MLEDTGSESSLFVPWRGEGDLFDMHAHMKLGTQSLEVCHKAFSGGLHCYDQAQGYHSLFYRLWARFRRKKID